MALTLSRFMSLHFSHSQVNGLKRSGFLASNPAYPSGAANGLD